MWFLSRMLWSLPTTLRPYALGAIDTTEAFIGFMQTVAEGNAVQLIATMPPELREQVEAHVNYCPRTEEGWANLACSGGGIATTIGVRQYRRAVEILRDVFCPHPPPSLAASIFAWADGCVVKLARGIDEEKALDRLPILGDALEEAGCTDAELLEHLRGPGPHCRGCWGLSTVIPKRHRGQGP